MCYMGICKYCGVENDTGEILNIAINRCLVYVQSMGAYAKALQLNPLSKTAAMSLAEVLVAQGKADEAAAW